MFEEEVGGRCEVVLAVSLVYVDDRMLPVVEILIDDL